MNSASLCKLAGRYDNPLPPRFLAPIDSLKIPALDSAAVENQHLGKGVGGEGVSEKSHGEQTGNSNLQLQSDLADKCTAPETE